MRLSATIHFVFCPSAAAQLRRALASVGRADFVAEFWDDLSYGPIDPPRAKMRLRWMSRTLGCAEDYAEWTPAITYQFWRQAMGRPSRRVVWTSSRSVAAHCAFMHWVERMGDTPYRVIDIGGMDYTFHTDDGRQLPQVGRALSSLNARTIAANALWDCAEPLEPVARAKLLATWIRLRSENAPLRLIAADGVSSAPISAFDAALLLHGTEAWRGASRLVVEVMARGDWTYAQTGSEFLVARVAHLIANGDLEARGESDRDFPYGTEVRLVPCKTGPAKADPGVSIRGSTAPDHRPGP